MSRLIACIVAIATILSIGPGFAHEFKKGSITVEHPWSRATPGGAQVATGYLTIENDSAEPDRLVSATAEIAGHTGIHQMSMVDGMMKMRELTEGLPVPADGSVALEPNSYHLMFTDLKEPLKEGDEFSGTLTFEKAGTVDVTFEVEGIGAGSPTPDEHDHHWDPSCPWTARHMFDLGDTNLCCRCCGGRSLPRCFRRSGRRYSSSSLPRRN